MIEPQGNQSERANDIVTIAKASSLDGPQVNSCVINTCFLFSPLIPLNVRRQRPALLSSHCDAVMKLLSVTLLCLAVTCTSLMSRADSSHMIGGFKAADHSNDEGVQKVSILVLCSRTPCLCSHVIHQCRLLSLLWRPSATRLSQAPSLIW